MNNSSSSPSTRSVMADDISARQARFEADINAAATAPAAPVCPCTTCGGDQMDTTDTLHTPGFSNVSPSEVPCSDCRTHISEAAPGTPEGSVPLCREGPENSPLLCGPCRTSYASPVANEVPFSLPLPQRTNGGGIPITLPGIDIVDSIRYLTDYADLLHSMILQMRARHLATPPGRELGVMPPEFDNMCHDETVVRNHISLLRSRL